MTSVVLVHGSGRDVALLEPLKALGIHVIDTTADISAAPRAAEEANADAAIIAADVEGPVRVARAIHMAAPHAHILFMTTAQSEPALRRELMLAPRIGKYWSIARTEPPVAAQQAIRTALEVTSQRRHLRSTVGRMNLRMSSAPPAPRAVVSDHFLAAVLYQLSDGVVMLDSRRTVVVINEVARRIFGPALRRGVPFASALASGGAELMTRVAAAEKADEDTIAELSLRRDDTELLVEVRITKVKNEVGAVVGTAILARDITQRRQEEERQRLITDASVVLSSTMDIDRAMQQLSTFLAVHLNATAAIDLVEGDGVTRPGAAVPSGDREVSERLRQYAPRKQNHPALRAFRTGKPIVLDDVSEDFLREIAGGEQHYQLMRSLNIRAIAVIPIASEGQFVGAFSVARADPFSDPELALLQELARITGHAVKNIWLYHAAEQGNRTKEQFLATLSHELRTPMTAVLGWIQLMRAGDLDDQTIREGLQAMEQSARVQAQLIDDLLDLSRIQMGKLHLQMQTVDLGQLVGAAVETIRPAARAKAITLRVDVARELVVFADPNRIQQVIWNLLSNSVKFTDRGGSVCVSASRDGSQAKIEVEDTGRGIEPDFLPYVFDRFRQADSAATRKYGGLGLGLSIVRQIVELHGGTATVASDGIGRGSTFTIRLPIPALRSTDVAGDDAQAVDMPSLRGISIVLAEDDRASAEVVSRMLTQAGAKVRPVASAAAALEALRAAIPDVLVSDIAMPEQDGLDLIRQVRNTLRISAERLPAIALSAFSDINLRVNVLGAGFQRFLQKPVDTGDLVKAISDLAAGR